MKSDFQTIVIPAVREYFEAEIELAKAKLNCADDLESVRQQVIRRARTASIELHQLTDAVGHGDPNAINSTVVKCGLLQRAVATVSLGYGALRFGEGKYGGGEQVIVEQIDGSQRALSSILQNCVDAWRRYFALPLPELGYF